MAEHMGRDMWQWFIRVQLLVFLHSPTHFIFDMQRYFRLIVLIQQKETTISVHNDFRFHFLAAGKLRHSFIRKKSHKAFSHIWCHCHFHTRNELKFFYWMAFRLVQIAHS